MIVSDNTNELETSITSSKNFTIKASPKAFKILSSGLYSNKIRAIIRELSCNAYDSHKAINNDDPFIVHLPTYFDDSFYVKDFGTGLSEENIMNLYTTYFDSNKTDSNDYIGALGLGSKSPFSYTDSFIVESRFNNKKTTYLVYLDENELPSISKLEECDSDEHSGLTVQFSVKQNDVYKFQEEAIHILSVFDKQPKIIGCDQELYQPLNFKDDYNYGSYGRYHGLYAFMGNILYPIKVEELDLDDNLVDFVKRRSLIIRFNIGDLDITPSREQLSYIKSTKEILNRKINNTIDNIINNTVNDINNKENTIEMIKSFNIVEQDIRALVYNRIDRDKFIFFDDMYHTSSSIFYYSLTNICTNNNTLDGIRNIRVVQIDNRPKSRIPYLTRADYNLFNVCDTRKFYISFNLQDDINFKYSNLYSSFLISVRLYKKAKITEQQIIDYIKEKYFIKDIELASDLERVYIDEVKKPLLYVTDMGYGKYSQLDYICRNYYNPIKFNDCLGLKIVEEIENDGKTFMIPCNRKLINNKGEPLISNDDEKKYYLFLAKMFTKYFKEDYKFLFCRNRAIDYVKTNYNIPNFFDYVKRMLSKHKYIKNDIIKTYNEMECGSYYHPNVEKIASGLNGQSLQYIKDVELHNAMLKARKKEIQKNELMFTKNNIEKLYKVKLKQNDNTNMKKYNDFFDLIGNMWGCDLYTKTNNIISMLNLIYKNERSDNV